MMRYLSCSKTSPFGGGGGIHFPALLFVAALLVVATSSCKQSTGIFLTIKMDEDLQLSLLEIEVRDSAGLELGSRRFPEIRELALKETVLVLLPRERGGEELEVRVIGLRDTHSVAGAIVRVTLHADEVREYEIELTTECRPDDLEACFFLDGECTVGSCDPNEQECVMIAQVASHCGDEGECDTEGNCIEGCRINGAFHAEGTVNPENTCEWCDPDLSTNSWRPRDEASCETDIPTWPGTCEGGICVPQEPDCAAPNECGGCSDLDGAVGDPCGPDDCPGELECHGLDELGCSADNVCCPGEVLETACPCSGEIHVCDEDGQWAEGSCEPECNTGEVEIEEEDCGGYCGIRELHRVCSDECTWQDYEEGRCEEGTHWHVLEGPVQDGLEAYNHIGTDGESLYVVFSSNAFFRYVFSHDDPLGGSWLELDDPPRQVNAWDSYSGMAHQSGFLYTIALGETETETHPPKRTILRYEIASAEWQTWENEEGENEEGLVEDLFSNAIIMDLERNGVGYAVQHGGYQWLRFDWDNGVVTSPWLETRDVVPGEPSGWTSRNDSVTANERVFFATRNDNREGLRDGDNIYRWEVEDGAPPSPTMLTRKPWKAGFGQSLAWVPGDLTQSCEQELWLLRGSDAEESGEEGWGGPTNDWARLPLDSHQSTWVQDTLPGEVSYNGELVRVGRTVFVRGVGSQWYVARLCDCVDL